MTSSSRAKIPFFYCVLPAVFSVSQAAESAIKAVAQQATQVTLTLDSGKLELRPISDRAIRVRFSDGKGSETPSFVQIEKITPPTFTLLEELSCVSLSTAEMRVSVDRATGAVRFSDSAGKVFLAEAPGTRTLAAGTVQGQSNFIVGQSFVSPPNEKLYGLGQYQDGLWNWRSIPLELRQLNTQIALPMLISNRGYGLLWDNASRTEFNSPGEQITLTEAVAAPGEGGPKPTATEQLTEKGSKPSRRLPMRHGAFTPGVAGDYVFCTRDGDRRTDIAILVDGLQIAGVTNLWTPRAVVGKITLPANKTCDVAVRGGGPDVKLFARVVGDTTTFRSDCGEAVDYTVFYGPKLDDVVAGYRAVTGQAPLWPKWAFGFWQCRERYSSQQQLIDTASEFRKRQIPIDLIVQDWQYWGSHGWGSYEWDDSHYPQPAELLKRLHEQNVKFMISVWCNPSGKTKEDLKAHDMLVGNWIDVFDSIGREIRWKHLNEAFFSLGTDAWWGDATEPGDAGTDLLGKKVSIGAGDRFTSAYPLFASQSLYEGQRATDPQKRVVTLTRSAFPGQQRYGAAAWSGDVYGDWETFKRQIPAGLNFCLTGQPFWTTDCGGFFRPPDQYSSADYNELLTRWFQWSTFCPILRIHGYQTQTELWKWLPETQKNLLAYLRLRYRMLPYNYSLGAQVTFGASTIMRALAMDFPNDPQAWDISAEYLFGPAFLVAPVTGPVAKADKRSDSLPTRKVYLPGGANWVNFWTGQMQAGGQEIDTSAPLDVLPLFVRGGSIVPLGPDSQYAMEHPADPIELRVYPGSDGAFTLYEDEGDSYRYENGARAIIPLAWDDSAKTLTIGERKGEFPGMLSTRTFRVVLVSPGQGIGIQPSARASEVTYTGRSVTLAPAGPR